MSNFDDARRAHRIMDALCNGNMVTDKEREFLRSFLPERPIQKGLEEIAWDIDSAWAETTGNDWKEEMFGDLETWLSEQHTQLRAHLEGVKSEAHPEFLETESDYVNTPVGTVVVYEDGYPWTRIFGSWAAYSCGQSTPYEMAALRGKARVLRWGGGLNEQL